MTEQKSTAPAPGGTPAPLLQLSGIVKRFPGTVANDGVNLTVEAGRIHALLGENGAGKSTLVKIIYGVLRPDAGELRWQGAPTVVASPAQARRLGIGMVFQNFSLFDALTVTENVALGLDDPAERRDLGARIADISQRYGLPLEPNAAVHDLSVGERQRIEIVRCLLQRPKLLMMDEPTSVLSPQEVEKLFSTLRRLSAEGCAILYISHKLDEIRSLCEEATILRQGRVVATCDPRHETSKQLAEMMIGAEFTVPSRSRKSAGGAARLEVARLDLPTEQQFGTSLRDVSFTVAGGEIFGVAGIAGNGQAELMAALTGESRVARTEAIRIDGVAVGRRDARSRRASGACFVPEERNGHAAVPAMSLSENAFLSSHARRGLTTLGLIDETGTMNFTAEIIRRFDVRTPGPKAEARSLSGGNLQKFVVGREVLQQPGVLVLNQPTWGVDAGAAVAIHSAILELAAAGAAIVVISQDLDEIFALADRVAVIANGRLSPPQPVQDMTVEKIGLLMGGVNAAAGA